MNPSKLRMVEVTITALTFPKLGEALAQLDCPDCKNRLDLHQPEAGFPDRLLGTCHHCHRWFVADFATGHEEGVVVFLPDAKFFLSQG